MGLFGKKKNKKKSKSDMKDAFDNSDMQRLSTNKIKIRVYSSFGSDVRVKRAEYMAEEKKDAYNNLVSINTQHKHNQDVDFAMDDVYQSMNIALGLKDKTRQQRIEILDRKIVKKKKLVVYLEKFVELNAIYNYRDEVVKLKNLKILRNHINNHTGKGSYFAIEDGLRVYSFVSADGLLVPIYHTADNYTQFPDHTRKKKINIQEEVKFRQEIKEYKRDKLLANVLIVASVVVIFMFLGCSILGFKLLKLNDEASVRIDEAGLLCAKNTARVNEEMTKFMHNEVIKKIIDKKIIEQNNEINEVDLSGNVDLTPK